MCLIGKADGQSDLGEGIVAGQHQALGAGEAAGDDEAFHRPAKGAFEGAGKIARTEARHAGDIADEERGREIILDEA